MKNLDRHPILCCEQRPAPRLLILAFLLLQFVVPARSTAAAVHSEPGVVSGRPGLAVAYADFDGDSQPDVAGVQVGRAGIYETEYWIRLRLSAAGSKELALLAPSGGIRIDARDVNGDSFPDLVVTTSGLQQPVAVYLNDGRGGFSRVDPENFPSAFAKSEAQWNVPADGEAGAADISQGSGTEIHFHRSWYPLPLGRAALTCSLRSMFGGELQAAPHFGRAPPAAFF